VIAATGDAAGRASARFVEMMLRSFESPARS
jgi:hypothetical protein